MDEETYTLEQIKETYWACFHEAGELWYDNESSTQSGWEDFLETLRETAEK